MFSFSTQVSEAYVTIVLSRNYSQNTVMIILFSELRAPYNFREETVTEVEYGVVTAHALSITSSSAKNYASGKA